MNLVEALLKMTRDAFKLEAALLIDLFLSCSTMSISQSDSYEARTLEQALTTAIDNNEAERITDFDLSKLGKSTVVHYICKKNKPDMLKKCIECGLDIDTRDRFGKTPLQVSLLTGYTECADVLIDAGVDVNVIYQGLTILEMYIDITPSVSAVAKLLKVGHVVKHIDVDRDVLPNFDEKEKSDVAALLDAAGAYSLQKMRNDHSELLELKEPERLESLTVKCVREHLGNQNDTNRNMFQLVETIPSMLTINKPFPSFLRQILTMGIKLQDYID